ncbi:MULTISPECIES: Clp protease/crotonase-like domain-containing protein [Xanthobacter]|uniref:hypothetical protein n=1 Tax=Xanthobacter TaxID=279 RepID=UPI0035B14EDC
MNDESGEGTIRTERRGALMLIGVDRPRKLNGFSGIMVTALADAYQVMEDEPDVRVGVLHAFSPHFTAGSSLTWSGPFR